MQTFRPNRHPDFSTPRRGFTLIELLVVLTIIALLASLALPRYFQSVDTAKETILADNLRITRETIDKFYGDTGLDGQRYSGVNDNTACDNIRTVR